MIFDASSAVALSFAICFYLFFKFVYRKMLSLIDQSIQTVQNQLTEAEEAKSEALTALNSHRRHHTEVEGQVKEILEVARLDAQDLHKQIVEETHSVMETRQRLTDQMLKRLNKEALQTFQKQIATTCIQALRRLIQTKMTEKNHETVNSLSVQWAREILKKAS